MDKGHLDGIGEPTVVQQVGGAAFRVEQPNIKRPWWKKLKPESLGKAKGADTTHPTLLALKSAVRKPPPATESQQNVVVVVLKKISLQDEVLYHASSGGAAPVSLGAAGSSAAGYVSSGFTTGLTTSGNGPSTGSGSGSRPSSHPGSRPGSDSVSPACPATVQSACINASLAVGTSAVPERESDRNSSSRSPDTVRGDRETDCERLRNSSANYDLRRNLAGEYASARDISSNQMLTSAVAAHTSHESRDDDQSNPRLHIDDSAEQAVAVPATGISESQHVQSQHTLQGVSMDELADSKERAAAAISHFMNQSTIEAPDSTYTTFQADETGNLVVTSEIPVPCMTGRIGEVLPISRAVSTGVDEPLEVSKGAYVHLFAATAPVDTADACGGRPEVAKVCEGAQAAAHAIKAAMYKESVAVGALPADVMRTQQDIMSTGAPEASDGESSPGPFHRRVPQQPTAVIHMGAEFIRLSPGGKESDMYKKPHLTPPETPTYIPPDEISAIAITPEQTQHIPCVQADPRLSGFAAEVSRAIKKTAQNACENGDSKNTICVLRSGMHATPDPSVPTTPTFAPSELLNGGECMTLMHVKEARNTPSITTSAQVAEVAAADVNSGEKSMHVSHASASHLTPAMFATYSGSEDLEDSAELSDAVTEAYNAPEVASSHQASLEVQLSENPASLPHLPDIMSAAVKVTISSESAEYAGVKITVNKDESPVESSMFFSAMSPKSGQIAEEVVTGTLDELATDSLARACMAQQHAERVLSLEGVSSVDALAAARLIDDATQGTCACTGGEVERYKLSIASSGDPWYSPQARSPAPPVDAEQRAMHDMQTPATSGPVSKQQHPCGHDDVEGVADAAQATAFESCAYSNASPQVDSPDGGSGSITICGDVPSSHPTQNPTSPSPLSQQHTVATSASGDNSSIMKAIDSNVQADIHRAKRDTESNAVNRWSPLWYCWDKDYVSERKANAAPMCGSVGHPSIGEEGGVSRGGTLELFSSVMRACMPPRTATESSWSLATSTATAPAAVNCTEATKRDAAASEDVHAAAVAAPAADAPADVAAAAAAAAADKTAKAAPAGGAAPTGKVFSSTVPADLTERRSTSTGAIVRATSGSGSALLCTSSEPNLSGAQTHTITSLARPPSTPTNASSPPSMPLVPPPALPPIRITHANPTFAPSATSACMSSPCMSQDAARSAGVYQDSQSYALPPPVFFSPATSSLKLQGQQNSQISARTSSYPFPHALPSSINETSTICTSVAPTHSQIQTQIQNEADKQGLAAEDQNLSDIMPPKHTSLNLRDSGTWREPSNGDKALPLHEITPEHACVGMNSSSPATLNVESARTPSPNAWPGGQDSYMHATPQLQRPEAQLQRHEDSEQKNVGDKQIASTVVSRLSKEDRAAMVELGRLSAIQHPNLVRYISCGVLSQKVEEGSGNTAPSHFIAYCQECPGGVSLRSIINDATAQSGKSATARLRRQIKRPYSFMEALQLSKQAVDALQMLHTTSPEVVHGGLTPDSMIVLKSKGSGQNVKLKGFGLDHIQHFFSGAQSEAFTSPETEHMQNAQQQMTGNKRVSEAVEATGKGTLSSQDYKLLYKAPEVLTGAQCDTKGDMYSLGVIMYELFTMRPLATTACIGTKHATTKAYTSKVHGGHREVLDESWPEGLRQAIAMCWHDCPDVRPSAAHLRNLLESLEPSIQQMDRQFGGAVKASADSTVQQNTKRVKGVKLPWKKPVKAQVDAGKQCAIM